MTVFQVTAFLFALFMMYVVSIHWKKRTLSVMEMSFWCSVWIFFGVITLFPDLLRGIAGGLHFARVFDLLVVCALIILTVVIFLSYFGQKEAQKKLENFIRQEAIAKAVVRKRKRKS